ncbi:hypothetical protein JCM14469_38090 [Desulfatiferula olefinivorans]
MSSILDALKKLDQEKDEPPRNIDWPQPIDTRSALKRRLSGRFPIKSGLAGLMAILVFGGAGWLALTLPFASGPRDQAVTPTPVPPAPTAEPPIVADAPEPAEPRPRLPRPVDDASTVQVPDPAEPPLHSDAHEPDRVDPFPSFYNKPAVAAVTVPPAPTADEAIDPAMADLLTRVPQELLPPRKLVDSGWLTLQAISWSETPERRIAVINAQLLKEGRRIDGALIRRIDRDYVVIEKDGEQLMLPFGNH